MFKRFFVRNYPDYFIYKNVLSIRNIIIQVFNFNLSNRNRLTTTGHNATEDITNPQGIGLVQENDLYRQRVTHWHIPLCWCTSYIEYHLGAMLYVDVLRALMIGCGNKVEDYGLLCL